jgi:hypothetical protein
MFTLTLIPSITVTPAAEDPTPTPTTTTTPTLPSLPLATAPAFPPTSAATLTTTASTRLARRHSTAAVLPLPPPAAAHDDRVSLAQRGMPVGSFKLNCVESIGALSPARSCLPSARGGVAKVFGWTTAGGAVELTHNGSSSSSSSVGGSGGSSNSSTSSSGGLSSPRSQSRSRHTRARSLNSLADLGIPPLHQPSPPPEAASRRSRHRSLGMDMNLALGESKFSIDLAVLDSTPSPSDQGPSFSFSRRSGALDERK